MSFSLPATILLVDDEPQNLKLLATLLKPEGYVTISAGSGAEALDEVAKQPPDLILLDIMMPGMDGYEVAATLKADPATASIPIIMLTALVDRAARLASLNAGVEEFLSKPVDRAELWLRVRNLLRLKAYADQLQNHGASLELQIQARTAELQRFRAAMQISGDSILLVDRDSLRYIDVNQTFCDLVGHERADLLGKTPMDLFSATRASLENDYDSIIADNDSPASRVDGHYRHKNGNLIPVETRRRALQTDSGWIIVCTARDVTERKRAEEEQRRGQEALGRFSTAMDATADAIYLVDRDSMAFVHVNEAACRMQSRTRSELLALGPEGVLGTSREELEHTYDAIIASGTEAMPLELARRRADGSQVWVELRRNAYRSNNSWMIVTLARDVTERKAAEKKIRRLNRVYAVLSGINSLIVRVRDRDELYRDACRIAVESGGFRMAWIGIVDGEAKQMKLVAREGGDQDYVGKMRLSLDPDDGQAFGLPGKTVLGKQPVVVQDMESDSRILLQKESSLQDFQSLVMLPLIVSKSVVGILALYAGEAEFFDDEEMKLLTELAGDISFAIDHIGKEEQLDYLAYYDALTGLANRTLFLERVSQHLRSAAADGHKLAVFLVDLERFKNINDSLGQLAGDTLLKQVAEWLKRNTGDASLVARIGADHFALVLPKVGRDGGVVRLVEKMMASFLVTPFRLEDAVLRLAAKVGVALYPEDGIDADGLVKRAEAALKNAKASGDKFLFYTQKMTERVAGKLTLENQLRGALDNNEFVLHFQPKVSLADGRITSAEALIRWNDPRSGLVPPGRFIPILEETGLIQDVGRWALREAVEAYLRWRSQGLAPLRIAVNVSPMQLRNRGFIDEIQRVVGIDPAAAAGLELEITESLIMEDVKHSVDSLRAIRAMGVRVAIDDFGTGFSSLSHLSRLPVDTLKIDRSFVIDMTAGPDGLALVSTIISLAHSLKLNVVAEGVETDEQSRLLRLLNCDEMQGYLFSKPVPSDLFEKRFLAPYTAGESPLATSPRFMRTPSLSQAELR